MSKFLDFMAKQASGPSAIVAAFAEATDLLEKQAGRGLTPAGIMPTLIGGAKGMLPFAALNAGISGLMGGLRTPDREAGESRLGNALGGATRGFTGTYTDPGALMFMGIPSLMQARRGLLAAKNPGFEAFDKTYKAHKTPYPQWAQRNEANLARYNAGGAEQAAALKAMEIMPPVPGAPTAGTPGSGAAAAATKMGEWVSNEDRIKRLAERPDPRSEVTKVEVPKTRHWAPDTFEHRPYVGTKPIAIDRDGAGIPG